MRVYCLLYTSQFSVDDFQFVGIDIIYTVFLLQVLAEISESSRKDSDLVTVLLQYIHPVSYTHLDVYKRQDIARMAGVSAGTVDRVLHNRGDVSPKSKAKVQKVLDEIHYQPNVRCV